MRGAAKALKMLITVAVVLALVPCSAFVQRSWAGASRTVTRARTDETYNGMYDCRGRPCRGKPSPTETYYTWNRTEVRNPATWSGIIRKRGYAPPWLFHFTTRENAREIMEDSRLRASNKNARFGDGIYFPSLPPWADSDAIIDNNYRGSCQRRDFAESFVAISIDSFPAHRALEHVNGSRDIWLLRGGDELSLFRAQASLFLDKDGIEPDAVWEIEDSVGYRRMKDQNYRKPAFGEPRYDRSANEMFDRVGCQFELVLEGGGIKAYPVDASATTPEDERDAAIPEDPARRPVHTEWCGPSSPDLLSGLLFQSIDPRTGRAVEPAGSPIEREEALRSMFISEREQPGTPTVPDLAARRPRSPLKRLVDLGFPRKRAYAVLCDTSRDTGWDIDAAFEVLSRDPPAPPKRRREKRRRGKRPR